MKRKPRQLSGGQQQRVALGPLHRPQSAGLPVRRAALQPRRQAARQMRIEISACMPSADDLGLVTHDQVEAMTWRSDRGDADGRVQQSARRCPSTPSL